MAVVVFKPIKPKDLNIRAFRLEVLNELRKEGTVHRQILARTTTNWSDRPKFVSKISLDRAVGAFVWTFPSGSQSAIDKWNWADQGTRPHIIRARRAPALRFQTGYAASTRNKTYASKKARRFGPWRRPKVVHHPGTAARGWSEDLADRRQRPFEERIKSAMQRAAKQAF